MPRRTLDRSQPPQPTPRTLTRKRTSPAENATKATKPKASVAKTPRKTVAAKPSARQLNQAALDGLGIDGLCDRLRAGETLTGVAQDIGLKSVSTLLEWLGRDVERSARAREARAAASSMYDEQAQHAIERAQDPLELAKARELAQHLRWRASKVDPAGYGDKSTLDVSVDHKAVTDAALLSRLSKLGVSVGAIVPRGPEDGDAA